MSHWTRHYLGQPWSPRRDCWGFFREVQRERFGRDLPAIRIADYSAATKASTFDAHPHRAAWRRIPAAEAREGDGLLMADAAGIGHVGIWVEVDGGRVLHCDTPYGVQMTPLDRLAEAYTGITFYRFEGDACQR